MSSGSESVGHAKRFIVFVVNSTLATIKEIDDHVESVNQDSEQQRS